MLVAGGHLSAKGGGLTLHRHAVATAGVGAGRWTAWNGAPGRLLRGADNVDGNDGGRSSGAQAALATAEAGDGGVEGEREREREERKVWWLVDGVGGGCGGGPVMDTARTGEMGLAARVGRGGTSDRWKTGADERDGGGGGSDDLFGWTPRALAAGAEGETAKPRRLLHRAAAIQQDRDRRSDGWCKSIVECKSAAVRRGPQWTGRVAG